PPGRGRKKSRGNAAARDPSPPGPAPRGSGPMIGRPTQGDGDGDGRRRLATDGDRPTTAAPDTKQKRNITRCRGAHVSAAVRRDQRERESAQVVLPCGRRWRRRRGR